MGSVFESIGDVISAPGDWLGQATEWVGERTGISALDNAGEWLSNDDNMWAQMLATGALGGGAAYMYAPEMFVGGMSGLSPEAYGSFGANELATWAAGAGEGLGEYAGGLGGLSPTVAGWTSGGMGSTAGLLGLGGLNLLGQYYGAQQQQKASDDAFNKQLAAQQAYQNVQRTDIANAQNTALANWQKYAFPNAGAINAAKATGMAGIGTATRNATEATTEQAAARGVRGPALGSALAGVQKTGIEQQAALMNQMNQFANTPYSAPPITTAYPGMPNVPGYSQPLSFGERAANMLGGVTGTMGGIAAYDWLKNR